LEKSSPFCFEGMKRQGFLAVLLVSLFALPAAGQTQDSYEYQSEFTWGINKNTYGGLIGGFVFKKARKLDDRVLETFGLEIMTSSTLSRIGRIPSPRVISSSTGKATTCMPFDSNMEGTLSFLRKLPSRVSRSKPWSQSAQPWALWLLITLK
jgi:hypothetical protein